MRRFFNPRRYRIVLFDQRGCGKSTAARLAGRQHHLGPGRRHRTAARAPGIERWQVFGGSWGSTLALAYAAAPSDAASPSWCCAAFSCCAVQELEWFYQDPAGAASLFPDLWEPYVAP
jgi:proline iminopeptidase